MNNSTGLNVVRFHNVGFSAEGVTLFDQQSKILFVAKKDIRQITLKYGYQSERPIVQVIFGIVIILAGLYFIANFILQMLINRIVYTTMLLSILLLPIGIWFMVDGLRKRLFFEIEVDNDTRKFPLGKAPNKSELQKFIKAGSQLGYIIDSSFIDQIN